MKNITISIDEETHRLAHIRASEMETTVPELMRQYLTDFAAAAKESERERRRRRLREITDQIAAAHPGFKASDNLSREELYDRARARAEAEEAKLQRQGLKEATDSVAATRPVFKASDNPLPEETVRP